MAIKDWKIWLQKLSCNLSPLAESRREINIEELKCGLNLNFCKTIFIIFLSILRFSI